MVNGKREYKRGQALPWEVLFILYEKLQPVCMEIEFPKENQKEKPDNCTKKEGGFRKQLELKKFKLFFLCIMHKEEGEENDKPRVVQSKQKEIM